MVDHEKVQAAVRLLLEGIGEDPQREGLLETLDRVARMYEEICGGMDQDPATHLSKVFTVDNNEMVVEKDIPFYSLCEHHLLPFFGKVHLAYIPNGKVAGLSKLARTVEVFARRLQLQERLTAQVADALMEELDAASHEGQSYSEQQYLFLKLLLSLRSRSAEPSAARRLADYVEQNIEKITSLSDLCDALHYSKNYVIRLFKRELGASPFQYVNEARLRRASYLLETTSRPLAEIARACGYSDYAYFYKRFLRAKGESPSQWRKRMHREPFGAGERS